MKRVLIGLASGIVAGFVMNQFSRVTTRLTAGHEGEGAAPGRERFGRGAQPPQALGDANLDAPVRVGSSAYSAVTGRRPTPRQQQQLGVAAHYAFSASLGVCYVLFARRVPQITAGRGALYGAAVWVTADEGVIPGLGLSRGPRSLGAGVLLYGLACHLVYGLTLDALCKRVIAPTAPAAPPTPNRIDEADEASDESFPASDPPAHTPIAGTRLSPVDS